MLRNLRSLSGLRTLRSPLTSEAPTNVELSGGAATLGIEESGVPKPEIKIIRKRGQEYALGFGLLVMLVVPSIAIVIVVVGEWQASEAQRAWLILGSGFYIVTGLRYLWLVFVQLCERLCYLRIEIRKMVSPTLFESVGNAIEEIAEKLGQTCSWDQEAVQQHDKLTGLFSVKLRFWSSQRRTLQVQLDGGSRRVDLEVQYSSGEDVVVGRDSHLERREVVVLTMRSSPETILDDKALLCRWMEQSYTTWVRPEDGIVNVHALQESSTDWVPTWAFERIKLCKSASGTGHTFFLERSALEKILADAQLWAPTALRVYLIIGPPGVGKSEFTIWLAGQLKVPVYRLCLSSPRLTDDRLAQLLAQSSVSHDFLLVQVDEFQETVQRWLSASGSSSGVSPGGFCECLQGSTAMGRGVVVLTGTREIVNEEVRRELPAVFRRIHREASLGYISVQDIRHFFHNFLARFLLASTPVDWPQWEQTFTAEGGPWSGSRNITIDMLKQFLMHQITEASCLGFGAFEPKGSTTNSEFHVHAESYLQFFVLICNKDQAKQFLDNYSPVHIASSWRPAHQDRK